MSAAKDQRGEWDADKPMKKKRRGQDNPYAPKKAEKSGSKHKSGKKNKR